MRERDEGYLGWNFYFDLTFCAKMGKSWGMALTKLSARASEKLNGKKFVEWERKNDVTSISSFVFHLPMTGQRFFFF